MQGSCINQTLIGEINEFCVDSDVNRWAQLPADATQHGRNLTIQR